VKRRKYNRTNKDLPLCGVSKLAIIVYLLGIAKIYKDGDGWSGLYRWWHPLSLIIFIFFSFSCLFVSGINVQEVFKEMFFFSNYWKQKSKNGEIEYFKLKYLKYYKREK